MPRSYIEAMDQPTVLCNIYRPLEGAVSIYIIQFVCLFVCLFIHDLGENYCTERHQTLRDYKVGLCKCPPRVEIAHLAVLEEISFYVRFFVHS